MNHGAALAALEMNMLRAVPLIVRILIDERIRKHRFMLYEFSALRHLVEIPVDSCLVHTYTVLFQKRRQFTRSKTTLHIFVYELRN